MAIQNETVKCTTSGTPSAWKRCDQAQPLERLPEFRPLRLHLPGRQDAVGIGADGEEGGIAQIEQAGEADDDVEAERQHGEGGGIGRGVDVAAVAVDQREEKQENRDIESRSAAGADRREARATTPRSRRRPASSGARIRSRPFLRFARHETSEQAVRPEHEHEDQDREDDHVGPAGRDELSAEGFDQPDAGSPPSMAPGMLPMPPSTAAVKARRPAV